MICFAEFCDFMTVWQLNQCYVVKDTRNTCRLQSTLESYHTNILDHFEKFSSEMDIRILKSCLGVICHCLKIRQ